MKSWLRPILGAIIVIGIVTAGLLYAYWDQAVPVAAMALNYLRYSSAPAGTLETEVAKTTTAPQPSAPTASAAPEVASSGTEGDWPSYNRTLTSNRFSPLSQINTTNAGKLKVLCTYDTGQHTGFTSGLLEVNDALIFVTEYDLFSIDPATCREKWRTHEDYAPATPQGVNRGAAYFDGMLFRGTQDGRVLAYDFKTGKRLWQTSIADPKKGESAPAAPIAWNGLVFIGDAGGDIKGVKGRMYALDAKTGKIVWEFYLVAKTGAYRNHFKIVPKDWHDWDVSSAPAIIRTAGGRKVLSVAPKDGHLYGFDLATNALLYRTPVTRIENADVPFSAGKPVHFCPGSTGGNEWNGPAYDPQTNLVYVGEVEWCTTASLMPAEKIAAAKPATPWSGEASLNPFNTWGKPDPIFDWAGWTYAVDADTGAWRWRAKTNYPIQSGMTPTAGGVVFFGDMGGNFYALDATDGRKLWGQKIGGAIGGGVITYAINGTQRVAVATGLTEVLWPTQITTAKVSVLGLE